MDDSEILSRLLEKNINIHPQALEELRKGDQDLLERLISETQKTGKQPNVITLEYLASLDLLGAEKEPEKVVVGGKKRALAEEYDAEILVRDDRDITNRSFSEGNLDGFVDYFKNRYERLANILRKRNHLKEAVTIRQVKSSSAGGDFKIIGMVNDIRKSRKGNTIIEVEDPTGIMPVIVLSNSELVEISREVVKDEVIGVEGSLGKNRDIMIANEIFFPDLPINREPKKSRDPLALAIISDIHMGSTKFLENEFLKFIKWLRGELGSARQQELAGKVKYLIVGGDLVDGVGIYPGQEDELLIKDINEQYRKFAEYLLSIPEYIEIIVTPGNHDAVRQAEPQPAISEEFVSQLYEDSRVHMVGNPCYTSLHGVDILSYHGRSLDDIISAIPNLSYSQPEKAMLAIIKKRHLSPIYGGKVPISPERFDYMVIEDVPDIFHFGHVHTVGVERYRGTTIINSGTFQEQTSFQRKMNMRPDPARIPIVDLQSHRTTLMRFM